MKIFLGQELEQMYIAVVDCMYVRDNSDSYSVFTNYIVEDLYGRPPTDRELRSLRILLELFKSGQNK